MTGISMTVTVLGVMAVIIFISLAWEKKGGQKNSCKGCPNYHQCRAHIGCSNNPNYGK